MSAITAYMGDPAIRRTFGAIGLITDRGGAKTARSAYRTLRGARRQGMPTWQARAVIVHLLATPAVITRKGDQP